MWTRIFFSLSLLLHISFVYRSNRNLQINERRNNKKITSQEGEGITDGEIAEQDQRINSVCECVYDSMPNICAAHFCCCCCFRFSFFCLCIAVVNLLLHFSLWHSIGSLVLFLAFQFSFVSFC